VACQAEEEPTTRDVYVNKIKSTTGTGNTVCVGKKKALSWLGRLVPWPGKLLTFDILALEAFTG